MEVWMTHQRGFRTLIVAISVVTTLSAQAPKPAFDVASVKKREHPAPSGPSRVPERSAVFSVGNATVAWLIQFAYDVHPTQIVGGPDWIRRDFFEINARAATALSNDEKRPMVRTLLEERFRLVVHQERRETRHAALLLARDDGRLGPSLTRCVDSDDAPPPVVWPRGGRLATHMCAPISVIANLGASVLGVPVVDKTGLDGMWRYVLAFADGQPVPPGIEQDPTLLPFGDALQEQLGLRVQFANGPIETLVIDSVQQPSEN
jgi:uncharacterized protein (TIGR03435 family)